MSSHMTAVELLNLGDQDRAKPFLNKWWPDILGVTLGVSLGCFLNFQTRRPVHSGIFKHVGFAGGLTLILRQVQSRRDAYFAEKDAVLRDYVRLHPEDFEEPPQKKIADILEPWIPVR